MTDNIPPGMAALSKALQLAKCDEIETHFEGAAQGLADALLGQAAPQLPPSIMDDIDVAQSHYGALAQENILSQQEWEKVREELSRIRNYVLNPSPDEEQRGEERMELYLSLNGLLADTLRFAVAKVVECECAGRR